MNPVSHFLVSWSLAESSNQDSRDKAIITWLGVAPDLDGLGGVVDIVAKFFGYQDPELYGHFHHELFHGLFAAILFPSIAMVFARNRLKSFLLGVLVIHLHLFCDLIGSRGVNMEDIWPINYLAPFSDALTLSWSGQWQINAWPNVTITIILIIFMFSRTITHGHSIVSLFNQQAHIVFVQTVQTRWKKIRGQTKN